MRRFLAAKAEGPLFWLLAIAVTAVACAALYYAGVRQTVNAATPGLDGALTDHFRLQLSEIDADIASGRLGEAEAEAARGEVARELLRAKATASAKASGTPFRPVVAAAVAATALVSLGAYALLGRPDLPAVPLSGRPAAEMSLEDAVARIEAQLTQTPDDLRGWSAIAPAY